MVGAKGLPFYGIVAAVADMFLDEDEDDGLTYEYEGEGGDFFSLDDVSLERLTSYVDSNPVQVTLERVGGELIFTIDPEVWAKINEDNS